LPSLFTWKGRIKNFLACVFYRTGILFLLDRILLKDRCVVLAYHRVCDERGGGIPAEEGMTVTPETFEEHLKYLTARYRIISLEEFLSSLSVGRPLGKVCLLTFDDGWLDNYENAFPLLRKYNVPATFFLTTNYIGTRDWFWPEKVNYILSHSQPLSPEFCRTEEARQAARIFRSSAHNPAEGIHETIAFLKQFPAGTIEEVIEDLLRASGMETLPRLRAMLDWSEVCHMARHGISFGSHTKSHAILTQVQDPKEIEQEILGSRHAITERTGKAPAAFCFPNGDYDDSLLRTVRDSGYTAAFIGQRGTVVAHDDPYRLKRIMIHQAAAPNRARLACRILFPWF